MSPRTPISRAARLAAERRRRFIYDLVERVAATFLEGFLGVVTLDGLTSRVDLSLRDQLLTGALTGGFAVLKCLAATLRGAADSASLLNADADPPQGDAGHVDAGGLLTLAIALLIVLVLLRVFHLI